MTIPVIHVMNFSIPLDEIVAFLGGALIYIGLIPQNLKIIASKKVDQISLLFSWMTFGSVLCFLTMAILYQNIALICWESFGLLMTITLLGLKLFYKGKT